MEVQRRQPRQVGQAELAAHGMDLVVYLAVARVSARIVADLPTAVARRTNFEQECLITGQRQVLADAPVEREALAGCQVKVVLGGIDFVGQRGSDGGGLVGPGIPGYRALQLVRPEAISDVVRRFHREGTTPGEGHGLRVVVAGRGVKAVGKRDIPMGEGHAEPDGLHIQVTHVKARVLDGAPAPGGSGQRPFQAGIGKAGRDEGAVFQVHAEWFQVCHPDKHRCDRIQVHIHLHTQRAPRPAAGIDGDGVDFVAVTVVEPTGVIEVIIQPTVHARLWHKVVADVQDAAVEMADLRRVHAEGRGPERDGQQQETGATRHRVFLLWVVWLHRVGSHCALSHIGASQVVVKRSPRASTARYSLSSRMRLQSACVKYASSLGSAGGPYAAPLTAANARAHGSISRAFSSVGRATVAVSTLHVVRKASLKSRGWTASPANASICCRSSATFCGFWLARLVFSEGSCARLKSSTLDGSVAFHTSFHSPWRTAPRKGSMS